MTHRNKQRPQGMTSNTTEQLFEYLDRFEAKLDHALSQIDRVKREQRSIAKTEIGMELHQMFNVQRLVDAAKAQTDATKAMKEAFDKVLADLREAQDDPVQLENALTAFEANTAVIAAAATSGTPADPGTPVPPVEVPPTGGSMGGVTA